MAENRSKSLLSELSYRIAVLRNSESILTQIKGLAVDAETNVMFEDADGKTHLLRIARVS